MNIYVGNLPYGINRDQLRDVFAAYGEVAAARVVTDRETGRSKGFGFVEMPNDAEANADDVRLHRAGLCFKTGEDIAKRFGRDHGASGDLHIRTCADHFQSDGALYPPDFSGERAADFVRRRYCCYRADRGGAAVLSVRAPRRDAL